MKGYLSMASQQILSADHSSTQNFESVARNVGKGIADLYIVVHLVFSFLKENL